MSDAIKAIGVLATGSIMRSLAGRMTRLSRTIDVVGRFGEHQLGLLLRGVRTHGEALRIAHVVYESLIDPPITTAGGEIAASVGCGVAFSAAGDDLADLIERASVPMWSEKETGDAVFEQTRVVADGPSTSVTMDDFRVAVSRGDIRPYAQPVVELASGVLVGYRGRRALASPAPRDARTRDVHRHDRRHSARESGGSVHRQGNRGGARARSRRFTGASLCSGGETAHCRRAYRAVPVGDRRRVLYLDQSDPSPGCQCTRRQRLAAPARRAPVTARFRGLTRARRRRAGVGDSRAGRTPLPRGAHLPPPHTEPQRPTPTPAASSPRSPRSPPSGTRSWRPPASMTRNTEICCSRRAAISPPAIFTARRNRPSPSTEDAVYSGVTSLGS